MSGRGDERAERILAQAVAKEPKDILGLLRALRRDMAEPFALHEGAAHALVHRMVLRGELVPGGRSPAGLVLYRSKQASPPPDAPDELPEGTGDPDIARMATKVASAVRDPAARGRVLADVRAHLDELAEAEAIQRFGRYKSLHTLMQRVDRGKSTVVITDGAGDLARRFVLHEGTWILGAALVFIVLKVFVVSPFKIPSESMLPTLEKGDRVAVFTIAHDGVPDRFDVMVYLKDDVNYVKRLIGLPGEEVALWRGDVYIDGTILVKPDWLVEALRSHVGTWEMGAETPPGFGSVERGGMVYTSWRSGRFTAHPQGVIGFGMHDGFVSLGGPRASGETIELAIAHGPAQGTAESLGWALRVGDGGIQLLERRGLDVMRGDTDVVEREIARLDGAGPTGTIRLELDYVDGVLRARCGDFRFAAATESQAGDLTVGLARSTGVARTLRLDVARDHHYGTPREATHGTPVGGERRGHRVPEGHVYCLGDNTTNSRDSRFSPVGDIPVDAIVGPVSIRIWPPNRWGMVR